MSHENLNINDPSNDIFLPGTQETKELSANVLIRFFGSYAKRKLISYGVISVVVISVLFWVMSSAKSLITWIQTPEISTNISVVINAVEACGEMTTYRAYFESVADRIEDKWFGRWRKFVVIFGGTVDCGFDMRRARAEIFESERKIIITLPHCRVLRTHVDLEEDKKTGRKSVRVYEQEGGWFSKELTLEEQNEVIAEALEKVREKAVGEWNALQAAEDNAAKIYKNFLKSFNYDVTITFTNDIKKLNVPSDTKSETMRGGGVLIVHHDPNRQLKEAK